jgi:dTDP-4-amino-4,6-dideoxygalactose transaminase
MGKLAIRGGTPVRTRPFSGWPHWDSAEEEALLAVLRSGKWWRFAFGQGVDLAEPEAGERAEAVAFQEEFARAHDCAYGIAAANGTATLEIGLRAMDWDIGDEVIVPAYTYVASSTAVLQNNMVPVFVDVDPRTYNIDPARVEEAVTDRTRAIMVVHFGGQIADMDALGEIARRRGLVIIEDAAHAHGCAWKGRKAGSLGAWGSFSFQASKNMTSGEGGIITTNDRGLATQCDSLLWSGRKVGRPWYEFHRLGWNYRITEFQAAILRVQLRRLDAQVEHRDRMGTLLADELSKIEGIRPCRRDPRVTRHGYHIFMLGLDEARLGVKRDAFLEALAAEGVPASGGYSFPLYANPMYLEKRFINGAFPFGTAYHADMDYAAFAAQCPAAEKACHGEAVWLTQNLLLGDESDMADIAAAVKKVVENRREL